MLRLSLSQQALKFLKKVPFKHGQQIDRTLMALKDQPIPHDSKRLKGTSNYFRVDIGEYRIIYRIDTTNELLIIAVIGKRNDAEVYKQFKRKEQ
jgi:mRNA interferase RelE/StbE